jgi:hypothetical protein
MSHTREAEPLNSCSLNPNGSQWTPSQAQYASATATVTHSASAGRLALGVDGVCMGWGWQILDGGEHFVHLNLAQAGVVDVGDATQWRA